MAAAKDSSAVGCLPPTPAGTAATATIASDTWSVKDGQIIHPDIILKKFPDLEHGTINKVNAIVVHRTNGNTVEGLFKKYEADGKNEDAAHFYIDGPGTIYQTGRIDRLLNHVGLIKSKDWCAFRDDLITEKIDWMSVQELEPLKKAIKDDKTEKKYLQDLEASSFGGKITYPKYKEKIADHESEKPYPKRWPKNLDSVGIEVTGKFVTASNKYEILTPEQEKSIVFLVNILIEHLQLDPFADIYPHGGIAFKTKVEGQDIIALIRKNCTLKSKN